MVTKKLQGMKKTRQKGRVKKDKSFYTFFLGDFCVASAYERMCKTGAVEAELFSTDFEFYSDCMFEELKMHFNNAHITSRRFEQIRKGSRVSKQEAVQLGLALRLNLQLMEDFIFCAGYELSYNDYADCLVIEWVEKELYDARGIISTLRDRGLVLR